MTYLFGILSLMVMDPEVVRAPVSQDLKCVATTVFGEARGEGISGMALVAQTIRNREAKMGLAPCTIATRWYSGYEAWQWREPWQHNRYKWVKSVVISAVVMAGGYFGQCPEADHFYAPKRLARAPYWAKGESCVIGNHETYALL